ncbi:hypothetical protein DOTSEDRAFT_132699, partial [Dothistroma septosporum NZE10]
QKTYNTGDSHVVTHRSTSPAVNCLYMGERTGSLILSYLWSYVLVTTKSKLILIRRIDVLLYPGLNHSERQNGLGVQDGYIMVIGKPPEGHGDPPCVRAHLPD